MVEAMKPRRPWRDEWRALVLAHGAGRGRPSKGQQAPVVLRNHMKLFCLVLHDDMQPDGLVSVKRRDLASKLGVSEKTITEWFKEAIRVGLVDQVTPAKNGQTAVYRALRPSSLFIAERRRNDVRFRGNHGVTPGVDSEGEPRAPHLCGNHGVTPGVDRVERASGNHGVLALSTQPQHSDAAETTGSNVASATENPPSTSDQSLSRSRRRREQTAQPAGLSSPSAPSTPAEPAVPTGSKVAPGVGAAAVARPPDPITTAVEDDYGSAHRVLAQLTPTDRDKCMAIAHNSLSDPSGRDLIIYAADVARSELGVAS